MAKNLMPEVAKLLGVEIGEKFIIENAEHNLQVVLLADGLHVTKDDFLGSSNSKLLQNVLCGLFGVKKLPWEPKYGKHFYTYIHNEAHNEWLVEWFYWYGAPNQLALKQLGMVFETQEDAEKALPEFYMKLTGKKLEG